MPDTLLKQITRLLDHHHCQYQLLHHSPTHTSEQSAQVRHLPLETGAKALLLKVDNDFKLFVLPAHRRLSSSKIKTHFHAKKLRFATPEELIDLTGLVPGAVPPFGQPLLPFNLYTDPAIKKVQPLAFNAGSLTDSIIMNTADYLNLVTAQFFTFTTK
jgi:Ala-tRNA(Pro) deacylase